MTRRLTLGSLLEPLVKGWIGKITLALEHKKRRFQDDADEALRFFNGPHDFMYDERYSRKSGGFRFGGGDGEGHPNPSFRMTINKAAEMVQLFGPVLYHKNPVRQVNPRKLPLPPIEFFGDPADETPIMPPVTGFGGFPPGIGQPGSPTPGSLEEALLGGQPAGQPQGIPPGHPGMPAPPVMTVGMQVLEQYAQIEKEHNKEDAIDKTRAMLMDYVLNYTPNELGLKDQFRSAIDEALIKGMGCLWTTVEYTKSGGKLIGSFYDTVDNLVIDADMESIDDAQWIAQRCIRPVWKVEKEFNLKPGSLKKGNLESFNSQGSSGTEADYDRRRGLTNDLMIYWKIYSKMGAGGRMSGVPEHLKSALEPMGDYCYLVVADNVPWPLNLPEDVPMAPEELQQRIEWPTPFWADNEWPFTPILFHPIPRQVWPMSHLKPAMGELKFLNWAYSFLAGKIRTTSRDFVACLKGAAEELKDQILHGQDLTFLEIEQMGGNRMISEVVQFLQHPPMQGDIIMVLRLIESNFEKRTGLSELVYGMSTRQMRSAEEASLKGDQIAIRPDDMSSRVEDAATMIARKEGIANRWHMEPQDVQPILGDMGAQLWGQLITSQKFSVVQELEYRIEAGSARKPNKDRDVANLGQAMQTLGPILQGWAMNAGDVNPFNALVTDWAKTLDLDAKKYLLTPPPPPAPPLPPPGMPPEGEMPGVTPPTPPV